LGFIFIGMANNVIPMTQGTPPELSGATSERESLWSWVPPALLATLVLVLGIWLPQPLERLLQGVAELPQSQTRTATTRSNELHPPRLGLRAENQPPGNTSPAAVKETAP
jgi:hypothetical protein